MRVPPIPAAGHLIFIGSKAPASLFTPWHHQSIIKIYLPWFIGAAQACDSFSHVPLHLYCHQILPNLIKLRNQTNTGFSHEKKNWTYMLHQTLLAMTYIVLSRVRDLWIWAILTHLHWQLTFRETKEVPPLCRGWQKICWAVNALSWEPLHVRAVRENNMGQSLHWLAGAKLGRGYGFHLFLLAAVLLFHSVSPENCETGSRCTQR